MLPVLANIIPSHPSLLLSPVHFSPRSTAMVATLLTTYTVSGVFRSRKAL